MKFMTVFIFSPAVWQSGAGHKASTLQFMQISALQCIFLLFPVFRSRGVLAIKIWGVELGLLAGGWQQVGEVASCRLWSACRLGASPISHSLCPPCAGASVAVADSTCKASSFHGQREFCRWLVTVWITALVFTERYWLRAAENITRCFIRKTSTNVQIKAQR